MALGITFAMSRLRSALGAHGVLDDADALDLAAHAVAGLQEPGGFMKKATPAGEPVTMMSPGNSVIAWLQ